MTVTPLRRIRPAAAPTATAESTPPRGYGVVVAVGAVVFWLAYDDGTYSVQSRSIVAVVAWWLLVLAVVTGRWPLTRLRLEAVVASAALAGFAMLSLMSIEWAADDANAFLEFNRVCLYVAVVLLSFTIRSPTTVGRWCDGIVLGISATIGLSLFARFFPQVVNGSTGFAVLQRGQVRLNYPLGNWNALAVFAAMAIPLALRSALLATSRVLRGLAIAPVPALAAAIYLTSSRTGAVVAALGVGVFFFLVRQRVATVAALVAAAAGSAVAVVAVASVHGVAEGAAVSVGKGLLVTALVLLSCLVAGAALLVLSDLARRLTAGRPSLERLLLLGAAVALIVAVVAVNPVRRFDDFQRLPTGIYGSDAQYVQSHLLNSSGNGRWQYWTAAAREFEAHPVGGAGAGSFEAWWVKTRPYAAFVRNAHSLYLEVLGELGVFGLVLIVAMFGAGIAAVVLRLRAGDDAHRATIAALGATLAAFVVAAGLDWIWQVTAVTIVGLLCLGFVVGPATGEAPRRPRSSWLALTAGVAVVAFALPVIVSQTISFLTDRRVAASQQAYDTGRLDDAFRAANSARNLEPWSDAPYVQLALVAERAGDLRSAAIWIGSALSRNPDNWSSWLVQARIEAKSGQIIPARRSLAHARDLNPLGLAQATR
jgi:tetratricopeptide (TPR) repeat protein